MSEWINAKDKDAPSMQTVEINIIHVHDFQLPSGETGECIKRCHEDLNGRLWVSDDTKASQVNFCPACGYEAEQKTTWFRSAHGPHQTPFNLSPGKD